MVLKQSIKAFLGFLLACLLAFTLQIFFFSPISPDSLELSPPSSASLFPPDNKLQGVIKLGEGFFKEPEDVSVGKEGVIYAATSDGWIKRLHRNGSLENWKMIDSPTLLGMTTTKEGDVVICDSDMGLLKIGENGFSVLTSHVNESKIGLANDVIEASDGSLYFSVSTTKYGIYNWYLDVLEAKPHGQLLKYDPSSRQTSIILDDLCFANGVALSKDQDYLVVCETWKFRCLKYWLVGENRGKTEIFIENLPGGPDNINLAPDGSFWIALLKLSFEGLEFVHRSKVMKKFIATFPKLVELVYEGANRQALVVNVAADGKVIKKFDDSDGKVMSFVTSAIEFEDHLYMGDLRSNFIGKLPLKGS